MTPVLINPCKSSTTSKCARLSCRKQAENSCQRIDIRTASVELPATLFVFDLLGCEGFDLRPLPLVARKRILERVLPPAGPVRYAEHFREQGIAMFEEVQKLGLEGIMAKKAETQEVAPKAGSKATDNRKITVIAKENPKRPNTKCHARFALYKTGDTVAQFLAKGGQRVDVRWDVDHGFIELKDAA